MTSQTPLNTITIRSAVPQDAKALLDIYSYYVEKTAITFEYDVPSLCEFTNRISNTLTKYPYLVAESGDTILGYAYVSSFHSRAAYSWAVETSIYVDNHCQHMGIGKLLYQVLESILKKQNIVNLYACIAYPSIEDEYLTKKSVQFHEHLGYRLIGEFYQCGYKFDRWYNMVWMEKHIGTHTTPQPAIQTFDEVKHLTLPKTFTFP